MVQLKLICFYVFLSLFSFYSNQSKAQNCEGLKSGTFYSYPKNSAEKYAIIRNGEYQYEKDLVNGDSIIYKIEWLSDCKYSLKFISTNAKMTTDESAFWDKHKLVYEITGSTSNYYTYKGYFDKTSNVSISADTMWLKEKLNTSSKELIQIIKSEIDLKKAHFTDTSKYAIFYLYREGKFAASKMDMLVYFDNNLICDSKSGSSYIFKVLKEGTFNVSAVEPVSKKSMVLPLTIQFGHRYYLRASAKFSVNMYGIYTPLLTLVDADTGKEEFLDAH